MWKGEETQIHRGEGHVTTETQTGGMYPWDKDLQWLTAAPQTERKARHRSFPSAFRGSMVLPAPQQWIASLWNCGRAPFCCFKPLVCDESLWQPWETNTPETLMALALESHFENHWSKLTRSPFSSTPISPYNVRVEFYFGIIPTCFCQHLLNSLRRIFTNSWVLNTSLFLVPDLFTPI